MRIIRYLAEHKVAVLLVACLLVVQAFCDLSLPKYTSDIVDVGIQQGGVEDAATTQLSADTFDIVAMLLSENDEKLLRSCYDEQSDGTYALNEKGFEQREELDEVMAFPLVAIYLEDQQAQANSESNGSDEAADENATDDGGTANGEGASSSDSGDAANNDSTSNSDSGSSLSMMLALYHSGILSKDDVLAAVDEALDNMDETSSSIMEQQAVAAAKAEYEKLGVDTSSIQMDYLKRIGLIMLGLAGLAMVVNILVCLIAALTGAKIGRDLRGRLFSHVISFSDREVNKFSAASLITRGTNDIQLIQMVCILFLRMVLYAPILAIGGIIMVSQTNLSMAWVIALGVVAILVIVGLLMSITMPKFKIMQKLIDKVNLVSREIITGLPVIRAFGMEDHEERRFDDASRDLMKTQLFTSRVMALMMPAMMLVMNALSVLIVWVGGYYVNMGTIQTGDLIAFITYSMLVVAGFLMIGMIAIFLPRANVAAERIDEVVATTSSIVDAEKILGVTDHTAGLRIQFDDVCFRYDEESANVLDHVSFVAEPGETTAIVGSTGSGKSTVVKLIERFYDVNEGAVLVDGVDVRAMSQHDLRGRIGYAPQKAFLFAGTIQSNIAYGTEDAAEERIKQSLDIAQATEFVEEREEGLATSIAQGGTNVSGGQRQRLAIARALAVDAGAYLFDDSFSALDYKTDAKLRQELAHRMAGKTVVIVAQRIATIMNADKIVVLENGKVVGQGTHAQLLTQCPEYYEIAHSQLSEEELAKGVSQHA